MATLIVAGSTITCDEISEKLLAIVKNAELLVAEERKNALKLLAKADNRELPYALINEHSTKEDILILAERVASLSGAAVFVSDCGTPCVADPDYRFIDECIKKGVALKSLPGESSIITALSISGFNAEKFIFLGFPPKNSVKRDKFFRDLAHSSMTAVFLERPYALERTVKDLNGLYISLAINLGSKDEMILRGRAVELLKKIQGVKAPFVVCVRSNS